MLRALVLALLVQSSSVHPVIDAWFGTWTLNIAKSTYVPGPPPYARAQYIIEPWKDGIKVTYDMVYPRGGTTHWEWMGKFDGEPYPLQGVDEYVTYAYQRVDDRTYDVVVRINDRPAGISRVALSADAKTITTTTTGKDSAGRVVTTTTMYERAGREATLPTARSAALQPANGSGGRIQRNVLRSNRNVSSSTSCSCKRIR